MSTTTKFTAGPWEYKDSSGAGKGIWANVKPVMGDKFTDLVQVWAWDSLAPPKFQIAYERWVQFPRQDWDEMQEANGRLIASAPELLAALEAALLVIEDYLEYDHNGDPWTEDARTMGEMDINDYKHDGRLESARAVIAKAMGVA